MHFDMIVTLTTLALAAFFFSCTPCGVIVVLLGAGYDFILQTPDKKQYKKAKELRLRESLRSNVWFRSENG